MAAALAPADLLVAEKVAAALKVGAGFDWKGALAAFESGSTEQKIVDGLIAADDVAQIVGLFFPPVAIIANDLGIAISAEQFAYTFIRWLQQQPLVIRSEQTVWSRITFAFNSVFRRTP